MIMLSSGMYIDYNMIEIRVLLGPQAVCVPLQYWKHAYLNVFRFNEVLWKVEGRVDPRVQRKLELNLNPNVIEMVLSYKPH